jgi:hypothetical protein
MKFERKGAPPVSSRVWEIATYRGDLIERMVDLYDAGSANEFARWMDAWGEGLDPRYVSRDQPASSAASRSASAMSSTVLALKNGSSGVVGQATVARR